MLLEPLCPNLQAIYVHLRALAFPAPFGSWNFYVAEIACGDQTATDLHDGIAVKAMIWISGNYGIDTSNEGNMVNLSTYLF